MYNPFILEGKTVLVTGASSGIGATIAILCSKIGAQVIITARNKERLDNTYSLLEGTDHYMIIADLSLEKNICKLVEKLPNLDGIVYNAGIVKTLPVKYINHNALNEIMQTNFYASVFITQQTLKMRKIKKKASIVFISSMATTYGEIGNSLYSASKGAINSFSKTLALEQSPHKIRVNCIQPAMVKTNILNSEIITQEQLIEDEKRYPLGRYGKPEDIANLVIYLLSDASEWMTGSIINIDGGLSLH